MPSLVSTTEVVARVPAAGNLVVGDLQLIIDANETLLRSRVTGGDDVSVELTFDNAGSVILLPYRFASIEDVVEHWIFADSSSDVTLAEDDWRLAPGGTAIERLVDGTNPQGGFADRVVVTGTLFDQVALRKNVLIQLCAVDVNATANAGIKRQRLGDYEEEKSESASLGVTALKEGILAQLAGPLPVFS